MEPSIRPDVTSALAANAARSAVISDDSVTGTEVVVGATVVGGASVVVEAAIVVATATVVDELASDPVEASCAATSPSAHAETTRTRTAIIMAKRLVMGAPSAFMRAAKPRDCIDRFAASLERHPGRD
jgi:hypothetical protein